MERLARVVIISENMKWQDLMSDDRIKSIGDLDEQKVMSLRTSALVIRGNELREESLKG